MYPQHGNPEKIYYYPLRVSLFALSLFVLSEYAQAASIATNSTLVIVDGGSTIVNVSDPQSATSGFITSVANDPSHEPRGDSLASVDGRLSVKTDSLAAGGEDSITVTASSEWSETFTNTGGTAADYSYEFTIPGGSLEIFDFANGPTMTTGFDIQILFDDAPIWESSASLIGGDVPGYTFTQTGTDIGTTMVSPSRYLFGPHTQTLDLGSIAASESFSLTYLMSASASGPGFETGAVAAIGDPFNLNSNPTFPGVSIVPVPAAVWLFGSGLLSLVGMARRKKAA